MKIFSTDVWNLKKLKEKNIIKIPWLILFLYSKMSIQNSFIQRTMYNPQGRILDFLMGVDDTHRPPNYTLTYFEFPYVCPKLWRLRTDERLLASKRFATDPRISILLEPRTYFRLFVNVLYIYFLVGCSKVGWQANHIPKALFPGFGAGEKRHPIHLPRICPRTRSQNKPEFPSFFR